MWNGYQPNRGGIRFFPHIVPIAFPLIFPFGIGLLFWLSTVLFHLVFQILGVLILIAAIVFIVRTIKLGSASSAWNSMLSTGSQWQQRFTSRQQTPFYQPTQQPYYQPTQQSSQEQASQTYGEGYQPQQPYYQPTQQPNQEQPYYRPTQQPSQEQPYYRPTTEKSGEYEQPRPQYPESMPPMQ
ncbi:hypothetical protein EPA93_10775 [Ktedonosporobacter rubrisoli]|uniref:Uncharacterized protein n=1 Tax=Ktedonosporobacter rubrisoli TaxID=2509675 RepID=A0A4P6JMH4_KTERU|nr:hypothetical protein [Ktedonosporobacter rubrisoli]QBD76468.1 hypothetical protein EPA93_10775 [Ktedonosporobacter rubrisoli]